ncbi:exported hypothetical protein [Verrucomicrobia bacterium]|nr:exported hypothetical protein [Verrucomicrobiota bacterium]
MKSISNKLLGVLAFGALSMLNTHAGNVTVLEGFEQGFTTNSQGITNLAEFTNYGTRDNGTNCTISIYTSVGPGDPRVTEGTNSAKVVFPVSGFGNDFGFGLSDAAAATVEQAAAAPQAARYILRYDVIFEHVDQLFYFNQEFFIGNEWNYVRSGGAFLTTYNGVQYGTVSFSVPLDLAELHLPTNSPSGNNSADFGAAGITGLTAFMSDNFAGLNGTTLTNFTIYIDNFRLIDTYQTPSTVPVVYHLQSFESGLGGAMNLAPTSTTLSLYTTNGQYDPATDMGVAGIYTGGYPNTLEQESDFAVTDGTNALEVDVTAPYYSYDVFSLPFAGTRLDQVLSLGLTPAQLAHYTLRWDVTTPMVPIANGGSDGDYIQIDYNSINGSVLPMSTGRRQSTVTQIGLQRETYSLTLDQIPYFASPPSLGFSYSQPGYPSATWGNSPFFFDNFRLINTAPQYTYITSQSYNPATMQITLTWLSEPSQMYSIRFSSNLSAGFTSSLASNIPSGGDHTTKTVSVPSGSGFMRIVAQ